MMHTDDRIADTVYEKATLMWKSGPGETIIVRSCSTGRYFILNPALSKVWMRLDGARKLADIVSDVCSDLPQGDTEDFRTDAITCFSQLLDYEVIHPKYIG
jgi:hypothetical protein